jgi:hypothetical protein
VFRPDLGNGGETDVIEERIGQGLVTAERMKSAIPGERLFSVADQCRS